LLRTARTCPQVIDVFVFVFLPFGITRSPKPVSATEIVVKNNIFDATYYSSVGKYAALGYYTPPDGKLIRFLKIHIKKTGSLVIKGTCFKAQQ